MGDLALWLGLVAVFGGIVLAVLAAASSPARDVGVARSLAAVEAIKAAPDPMRRELDKPFGERVTGPSVLRKPLRRCR